MPYHHYVSKSFIKYWQPSYDEKLSNQNKSNGGVYIHDLEKQRTELKLDLTTVFSEQDMNDKEIERKISSFIEKYLGCFDEIKPEEKGFNIIDLEWKKYRALILLTSLQAARVPRGGKPPINEVLGMTEENVDKLSSLINDTNSVLGIILPENMFMFLNDIGFFVFPLFDFRNKEKVMKATKTSELWGIAVPIRPNFCIASVCRDFVDSDWILKNTYMFQTYSVGLKCSKMIVPPRLKDRGELYIGGVKKSVTVQEVICEFQKTVGAANELIKGWGDLSELEDLEKELVARSCSK